MEFGELIKTHRLARKLSLRQLGTELKVTGAYIADIEANRRLPSSELRGRIAAVLEIPPERLAAADARLSPELREWIEERPQITAFLRLLHSLPESDMLIQRLTRIISRRSRSQEPRGVVLTWESELRAIAAEASAWSIETGGDLFGRWNDVPIILLATKAGPKAQRDHAHFRLDVDYLRELSEGFASDWALRYFGDWHSHHRLGLSSPSSGDRKRILSIAGRNQFLGMTEIIVTLEDSRGEPTVRIHPWLYDFSTENGGPFPLQVKVLPGVSPIRQALLARKALPEQELMSWEKVPLQRIRIGSDVAPPVLEPTGDVDSTTRERTLAQLADALRQESGGSIEQHATGFGCVLVAKLNGHHHLAFALGAAWPMGVLEVHRLDRGDGSTTAINAPQGLVAADVNGIIAVYRGEMSGEKGTLHVDA